MKKICIISQSHLCRNPRVVKEANALDNAGYDVSIITTFSDEEQLEEDKSLINKAIKLLAGENIIPSQSSILSRFMSRMTRRIAYEMVRWLRWETPQSLSYGYCKSLRLARKMKSDLYICHQELPLVLGCKLLKEGFKVAFDIEDWYSNDLPEDARKYRPLKLLQRSEKFALENACICYTTSKSMAKTIGKHYGVKAPEVLYNTFPLKEREELDGKTLDRKDLSKLSINWFSQTVGYGRGLEFLLRALEKVNTPVEVHIRGNCSEEYASRLRELFPVNKGHDLFIHPIVPHKELLSRIAEHDIGLALEEDKPFNKNLTISNKILQYLLAGIAVAATDTDGHKEVASESKDAVFTFRNYDEKALSHTLNDLLEHPEKIKKAKKLAVKYATEIFCSEKQQAGLLLWIKECLN